MMTFPKLLNRQVSLNVLIRPEHATKHLSSPVDRFCHIGRTPDRSGASRRENDRKVIDFKPVILAAFRFFPHHVAKFFPDLHQKCVHA
jgi:hypothetical protein